MKRYGKSVKDISQIKKSFISDNDALLERSGRINRLYLDQPLRSSCKCCGSELGTSIDFINHNVGYSFCDVCGHLNGTREDTDKFCDELYSSNGGNDYASNYLKSYNERVDNIYTPKVNFLIDSIRNITGVDSDNISVSDLGCGGGHFISGLCKVGISCYGYDISSSLIQLAIDANQTHIHQLGYEIFKKVENEAQLRDIARHSSTRVISMIGVLEHLSAPRDMISSFLDSNAEYLYISVPMFSLSVILENSFPGVFPRQLSSGHTHLYTEKSIAYMLKEFNLVEVSSWRFGTDIQDLRRSLLVNAGKNCSSEKLITHIKDELLDDKTVDRLQSVLDANHTCSEIHIILKKG